MYILTKRAVGDNGRTYHLIHGGTENPETARCWFRSSATTDVVEIPQHDARDTAIALAGGEVPQPKDWHQKRSPNISAVRLEGWRDQWAAEQLLIESLNASAQQKAKRP